MLHGHLKMTDSPRSLPFICNQMHSEGRASTLADGGGSSSHVSDRGLTIWQDSAPLTKREDWNRKTQEPELYHSDRHLPLGWEGWGSGGFVLSSGILLFALVLVALLPHQPWVRLDSS